MVDDPESVPVAAPASTKDEQRAAAQNFWKQQIRIAKWGLIVTAFAAIVGLGGLVVLFFTLEEAKFATKTANRAWIAPRNAYLTEPLALGQALKSRISYDNPGKTPALDIGQYSKVHFVDANSFLKALSNPITMDSIMGANTLCNETTPLKGARPAFPTNNTEVYQSFPLFVDPIINDDIISGKSVLIIHGCIAYTTFLETHKSGYCFYFHQEPGHVFARGASAAICPAGSYAD